MKKATLHERLWAIVAAAAVLALVGGIGLSSVGSAATPSLTSTNVLYVGHGVGVVATINLNTDCSEVFLTTDFVHWRNITPPLKTPAGLGKGDCLYIWSDAFFVSTKDGWLLGRNAGSTQTILRRTLDAGRTWTRQPGGDTGSNGGYESVSFVNSSLGWRQQYGMGSNGAFALQRTLNGGTTWSTRAADPRGWCPFTNDVFSSAVVGFAYAPWNGVAVSTHLWRSTNGGVSWSTLTLSPPSSLPRAAQGLYGEPEFAGRNGVVAVDYPVGHHQAIVFDVTHDGGLSWSRDQGATFPISVKGSFRIRQGSIQSCFIANSASSNHVAVAVAGTPATWWVVTPGIKGETTRIVATGNGGATTAYVMKELPATNGDSYLRVLNANDALYTFNIPAGYDTTYETSNGGVTWTKLAFTTARSLSPGAVATCATSGLRITPGRSSAALGHVAVSFAVKNVGRRSCELDGYPSLQMITSARTLVATRVTFGADYVVPALAARVTLLRPGASGAFVMGYADATGYGSATCPSAVTLAITPPGDQVAQDVHLKIQPFGGSTIQTLVCGEVAVSPIVLPGVAKPLR